MKKGCFHFFIASTGPFARASGLMEATCQHNISAEILQKRMEAFLWQIVLCYGSVFIKKNKQNLSFYI